MLGKFWNTFAGSCRPQYRQSPQQDSQGEIAREVDCQESWKIHRPASIVVLGWLSSLVGVRRICDDCATIKGDGGVPQKTLLRYSSMGSRRCRKNSLRYYLREFVYIGRHQHFYRDDGGISTRSFSPGELPHYLLEFVFLFLEVGFKSFVRGVALLLLAKGFDIVGWKGFELGWLVLSSSEMGRRVRWLRGYVLWPSFLV